MNDSQPLLSAFITSTDVNGNTARINTDAIDRITGKCLASQYDEFAENTLNRVKINSLLGAAYTSWEAKETPIEIFNKIQTSQISRLESLKKINIALPSLTNSFNSLIPCTNMYSQTIYIQADAIIRIDNETTNTRLRLLHSDSVLCLESTEEIEESIKQAELRRIKALSQHNLLIR
jgi:hypothetical protein